MTDRFPYNPKGLKDATDYLKSIGKWEELRTFASSWTIIDEANSIKKINEKVYSPK